MFSKSLGEGRQKFTCTVHGLLPGLHEQWVKDNNSVIYPVVLGMWDWPCCSEILAYLLREMK